MLNKNLLSALLFSGLLIAPIYGARADWEALPESRHQLYQSYSFFIEQHNMVLYRGNGEYWAAVATTFPLAGNNDSLLHPQILFHFSGNDSMHVDSQGGVYTETLDTRIGLLYEFAWPTLPLRFSIGYFHESGHVVDGVVDTVLIPTNLGLNVWRIRGVYDYERYLRLGITFDPVSHSIPDTVDTGLDEFLEIFPFGSREDTKSLSPFVAGGVAHAVTFAGSATYHVEGGVAIGSHFQDAHTHDARLIIGYFSGPDPRAKYAEFLAAKASFTYFGAAFDL